MTSVQSGEPQFTEATTGYWQQILPASAVPQRQGPWQLGYPAELPDGRVLMLPIRALPTRPGHAVASLLCNHAALDVLETLGTLLAERLEPLRPEMIVGLPTLGLALAPIVARHLGHTRFVPMGYSRKFWYDDNLSATVQSITSPGAAKRVYLDPHLLPLIAGRRVVLVDDVVSTGSTARAPWSLLQSLGAEVLALGVAMRQGTRWVGTLAPERAGKVVGVLDSPLLQAVEGGWG